MKTETIKIGWFYKSIDDYKKGNAFKFGIINEFDECIEPLETSPNGIWTDEKADTMTDEELKELIPDIALSTAELIFIKCPINDFDRLT